MAPSKSHAAMTKKVCFGVKINAVRHMTAVKAVMTAVVNGRGMDKYAEIQHKATQRAIFVRLFADMGRAYS